jgi:hypothetical protein
METLEDIKAKARQKIEAETTDTESYTGQIGMMLLSWIDYADNAAELILTDGKTIKGAFEAIRDYASVHRTGNYACVPPTKAMELVLEYFEQEEPQAVIEGGLMYKVMTDEAARFKPYGTETPKSEAETTESGTDAPETETITIPSEQKTQPVAEETKVKNDLSALSALSLEDLGL